MLVALLLTLSQIIGYITICLISLIGLRFLWYFRSYLFHWRRYRQRKQMSTRELQQLLRLPFVKIQITTRGSEGSMEVMQRGIDYVMLLARDEPQFYQHYFSIEIVTENISQKEYFERTFSACPIPVSVIVMPKAYQTPRHTQLKARGLHYMVEMRRLGLNRKPGRTFIVHYDEESVMTPAELRNLWWYLAHTSHWLMEGPIYYPFEYLQASVLCRAMEANRPIGCCECREVMERGVPLHLHGSNLVIDEALENELGWDIGNLDGRPFIAEDYVFGVKAFLRYGPSIFGWHGCVMLEQPPFSFQSAFRQRYRWIVGVLQGIEIMKRLPTFHKLSRKLQMQLTWGTKYRIATFALGLPAGALSLCSLCYQVFQFASGWTITPLPLPLEIWLILVGFLWLNSVYIGAYYNISTICQIQRWELLLELAKVITIAPLAGILESSAALWAVWQWASGKREVIWTPTPKTGQADKQAIAQKEVAL
jgi:hypothetical protein